MRHAWKLANIEILSVHSYPKKRKGYQHRQSEEWTLDIVVVALWKSAATVLLVHYTCLEFGCAY